MHERLRQDCDDGDCLVLCCHPEGCCSRASLHWMCGDQPHQYTHAWLQARSLAAGWSMLCNRSGTGDPAPLVVPIFPVSCVSGMGLAPLHAFLAHLNLPSPHPAHAASADMPRPSACAGAAAAASPPTVLPERVSLSNGDQQHGVAVRPNGVGLAGALQNPVELPLAAEPCQVIFQVRHGS